MNYQSFRTYYAVAIPERDFMDASHSHQMSVACMLGVAEQLELVVDVNDWTGIVGS